MDSSPFKKDNLFPPDTNKPSKCDLCGHFVVKDAENRLVTAGAMRWAVSEGFHVAKEGIKATAITFTADGSVDHFKRLVATDPNDWLVCPGCWGKLKKYMKNPDYGEDVKPVPVFKAL